MIALKFWRAGCAILVVVCLCLLFQTNSWAKRAVAAGFAADSLQVELDSSKVVAASKDSSILVWQRRAFQAEQIRDSIGRRLAVEVRARGRLSAQLASLQTTDTAEQSVDSAGSRAAEFNGYVEPFTYRASVLFPPAPTPAELALQIDLDPIPITARFSCGEPVHGIRPALFSVEGPAWAGITVHENVVTSGVCNPRPRPTPWYRRPGFLLAAGAVVGFFVNEKLEDLDD